MSPNDASTISDQQSERRRGRPPLPREQLLQAADAYFARLRFDGAVTVSMDAIAEAAGVGKATLFRAFGSRQGLLDALFDARLERMRAAVEDGDPPLGPGAPPRERIAALLDAMLAFKLDNRHLIRARELHTEGLLQADYYRWLQATLRELIERSGATPPAGDAGYAAYVLLGALRPDLIDELLAAGRSAEDVRGALFALADALLGRPGQAHSEASPEGPLASAS